MRPFLFSLSFLLVAIVRADVFAVFGKNQISVLDEAGAISAVAESPSHHRFLEALGERMKFGAYKEVLPILPPPEWGKTIEKSGGEVQFQRTFAQGFVGRLTLHGLAPRHTYLLTFNGTPDRPGNERLPDPVPGLPEERFYDFLRIVTDPQGNYKADLGVYLLPGEYHVRIYVKDTDDFKIVLYRDYFDFTVTPDLKPMPKTPTETKP